VNLIEFQDFSHADLNIKIDVGHRGINPNRNKLKFTVTRSRTAEHLAMTIKKIANATRKKIVPKFLNRNLDFVKY
jgi:hypothetical protein